MRAHQFLTESKGIMGRIPGDKFTNGDNILEFQNVTIFPEEAKLLARLLRVSLKKRLKDKIQLVKTPFTNRVQQAINNHYKNIRKTKI